MIKRGKYIRNLKYLIVLIVFSIVIMTNSIYAMGTDNYVQQKKGLQVYILPNGTEGIQNGDLWVYVEMLDEHGTPYIENDWAVECTIVRGTLESDVFQTEFQKSNSGKGFVLKGLVLGSSTGVMNQSEYREYAIIVSLKNSEGVIEEKSRNVFDALMQWPELSVSEWEAAIDFNEVENPQRTITFNVEDQSLFARLYDVSVDHQSNVVTVNKKENLYVWDISLNDEFKGSLEFELIDEAGNSQNYTYRIDVTKEGVPFFVFVLAVIVVVLCILVGIILYMRKKEGNKIDIVGIQPKKLDDENTGQIKMSNYLRSTRNELKKAKGIYLTARNDYLRYVKDNQEKFNGGIDENIIDLSQEETYRACIQAYENAIQELSDMELSTWSSKGHEITLSYNEIIRDMSDYIGKFKNEKARLIDKKKELEGDLKQITADEKAFARPLGMFLQITVVKGDVEYQTNTLQNQTGFWLDDRYIIKEGRFLRDILGEKMGIKFLAIGTGESIEIVSDRENLFFNNEVVRRREIKPRDYLEFKYQCADNGFVLIRISSI